MMGPARILAPRCVPGLPRPWTHILPGTGQALDWLRRQGCAPGTRVALGLAPTPASAALLQAAVLAGATAILIPQRLHPEERQRLIALARARLLISDRAHPLEDDPGTLALPAGGPPEDQEAGAALAATLAASPGAAPALILATSGTTGTQRLVRLSHAAIAHGATASCRRLGAFAADTWLVCLPLDHIGGAGIILRSLACGCRLDMVERFDPGVVAERIAAGASIVSLVPTMLHRLLAKRGDLAWPATLRLLLLGGGPLSPELIHRCTAAGLAPCQTYGLSEAASQVCTLSPDEAAAHPGSAGRPLEGMEVAVRDAAGTNLTAGAMGIICIRGPCLCDGYEAATSLEEARDAQGWFATGDVGCLDRDGFLTVLGRHDEIIVSGGENIAPVEVEAVLERHPAVAQAGVYGQADAEWGQVVCAALVARDAPVADAVLDDFLLAHLSRFKRPRRIAWVRELPLTASGKLQRGHLAAWVACLERR